MKVGRMDGRRQRKDAQPATRAAGELHWHSRGSVSYIRQEDSRIDPPIDVLVDDHLSHGAAKPSLLVQLLVVWFQDQGTSNLSMKRYIQSS